MPIKWPDRCALGRVFADISDKIAIAVAPEAVWNCLLKALDWPVWYRAGWNMVTSGAAAGRNFGSGAHPEHDVRYGLAHQVIEQVQRYWTAEPGSPQGQPVLIQAGMSPQGLAFASSYGEAIFAGFKICKVVASAAPTSAPWSSPRAASPTRSRCSRDSCPYSHRPL